MKKETTTTGIQPSQNIEPTGMSLREKAEEQFRAHRSEQKAILSESDTLKLLHELEVHQIELEMQNEELRMAEHNAKIAAEKYTTLYDFAPSGYLTIDRDSKILEINLTGAKMLGKVRSRLIKNNFKLLVSLRNRTIYNDFLQKLNEGQTLQTCEVELLVKEKPSLHLFLSGIVSDDKQHYFLTAVDITERKRAEEAERASEILHSKMISNIGDVIVIIDCNGNNRYKSPNIEKYFGWKSEDVIGKPALENVHPDDLEFVRNFINKLAATPNAVDTSEIRYKCKDGSIKWIEFTCANLLNDPTINGLLGNYHDITERHLLDNVLQEKEILLSKTAQIAKLGGWKLDIEANELTWTQETYRIHEVSNDFIPSVQRAIDFYHPDDKKTISDAVAKAIECGDPFDVELRSITAKGKLKWVKAIGEAFWKDDKVIEISGTIQDITERKQAEEELIKSKLLLSETEKTGKIGGWEFNIETLTQTWTEEIFRILEIDTTKGEPKVPEGLEFFAPEYRTEAAKAVSRAIEFGEPYDREWEIITTKGNKRWVHAVARVNKKEGKIISISGSFQDITDRKRAEQELVKAKEHAEESDRLKSSFLANMSHEIRTPLNSVIGFSELLSNLDFETDQQAEFAQIINISGNNLLAIINDIMDISKIEAGQIQISKKSISVNQIIKDVQDVFLLKASKKGIELKLKLQDSKNEMFITSDPFRLKQILTNFIGNALKFTSKGYIEIGFTKTAESAQFYVKDTGIGIAKEFHQHIFERFKQVDSSSNQNLGGTGLGLAISKSLVELLGGKIWIESEVGKGSTFYFTIPKC